MKNKGVWLAVVFIIFLISMVQAQAPPGQREFTHVIANSEDWRDVYSIIHYSNLIGAGSDFLVSTSHGRLLLPSLNKQKDIRVISSSTRPFVINYPSQLLSEGYADADEVEVDDANLELMDELPDINDFIVISNNYGFNAIAVAPYGVITDSWIFFADRTNIDDIDAILADRQVDSLLVYGFVERDVEDTLAKYNPERIDTGDRFLDNIEIVERYREIKPIEQVVLTNGEFIEQEVMSGLEPVLFTGSQNVPEQVRDYLQDSDIQVGVLVGSELVGAATNIRRSTGISVIVKFARGARSPESAVAAVEGLDLFYLATPEVSLELQSVTFNSATEQLEVTYQSLSNVPIYFRGTINPQDDEGVLPTLGDVDPIFIAPNDFKTITYPLEFTGQELVVDVDTVYGETPTGLDHILSETVSVEFVNIIDQCDITIQGVTYRIPSEEFKVKIKNEADIDCWVDVELHDIIINGDPETIGSEGATLILQGKSEDVVIPEPLAEEDLEENSLVDVIAYYGERENNLVKVQQGTFELKISRISILFISIMVLIILIVVLILLFLYKKWRERKDAW